MAVRSEWLSAKKHNFLTDLDIPAPRNTFLAQLGSIDVRSSEFTETLAKILSSQEDVNTAISLEGDDALTFVDILDQVSGRRTTAESCLTPPHRLWNLRTWTLASGQNSFASFGKFVVHRPSSHLLLYSRTT